MAAFYADDFVPLHSRRPDHAGVVVCSQDDDELRQATAIDAAVRACASVPGTLLRVNRPA